MGCLNAQSGNQQLIGHIYIYLAFALFHALQGEMYYEPENEVTIRRRCHPSLSCFPGQLEWAKLEHSMAGYLIWPDHSNYTHYNWQINLAHWKYPIVHAVCKTAEDIQLAVRFANKHNLRVTIKSEGNDPWGRSSAHNSFTINLMEMKQISVNPEATARSEYGEITVETGVSAKTIYDKVEEYGRIFPLENKGMGLFISTGGYGFTSPTLGLGVDSVLEIKVVLADGRMAICTHNKTVIEDEGAGVETRYDGKLFWALRGGGGGTFAVVIHYVLKLDQAPESYVLASVTGFLNETHADIEKEGLEIYDHWVRNAPTHWGGFVAVINGFFVIRMLKFGHWDEQVELELEPFLDFQTRYKQLLIKEIRNVSSSEAATTYGSPPVRSYGAGAFIPPDKHNATGLRDLVMQEVMDPTNGRLSCFFMRLGGKVAEYAENSSSVHPGFRRAQSHLGCFFNSARDEKLSSIELQVSLKTKTALFAEKLRPYQDGQDIHMNYIPSPNWKMDFWGENYVELLKVKIRYDPDNLFTCYHCVGSDRTDFDKEPTSAAINDCVPKLLIMLFGSLITML